MARQIRIEYEGAMYHVMARGNRRERIFVDDEDRQIFLKTIGEACEMTGWRVHAWVLMDNHYHLLIETPEANLVSGMKWVQNAYTRRFNVRHHQWGRLFGDRYKAVSVEGGGYYYQTLLDYIHLNPVRARMVNVSEGQSVMDYVWSSLACGYVLMPGKRAPWLAVIEGLNGFGFADTVTGRRRFVERLNRRVVEEGAEKAGIPVVGPEVDARCSQLQRGWYWGSQAFAEGLIELGKKLTRKQKSRIYRSADERHAHHEVEAQRILAIGCRVFGLDKELIAKLPGSDSRKVAIAKMIWSKTTVSQQWIAEQLGMKTAANVSQQIKRSKESEVDEILRKELGGHET